MLTISDSDTVPTVYFAEVEYRYQPITGMLNVSTDCLNYYESQQSRLIQTQSGTSVTLHEAMANKMVQGCYTYADVPFNVDIDITFLPEYFETSLANIGTVSVPQFRQVGSSKGNNGVLFVSVFINFKFLL